MSKFVLSLVVLAMAASYTGRAADEAAPYTDPRTGLVFQFAGKASTTAEAAALCQALPGTVPANRYFLATLWHGWAGFQAAQKEPLDTCLFLSPFDGETVSGSETCVSMRDFGYYAFHEPKPVVCVATAGQKPVWNDAKTGANWQDIGLVTSEDDAKSKCSGLGERWRLADVRDVDMTAARLRDTKLNPDLKVDAAGCYVVTYNGTHQTTPTCSDLRGYAYLSHFPTRALCVQDKKQTDQE